VSVVMGMEWQTAAGIHNVAFVLERDGRVQGTRRRTSSRWRRSRSTSRTGGARCSRWTVCALRHHHLPRGMALPEASGGPPSAAPAWSSTPSSRAATGPARRSSAGGPDLPTTRRR
jgi:hypothetical protein